MKIYKDIILIPVLTIVLSILQILLLFNNVTGQDNTPVIVTKIILFPIELFNMFMEKLLNQQINPNIVLILFSNFLISIIIFLMYKLSKIIWNKKYIKI